MDLVTFERELSIQIGRPTNLRPFVCQGSPLDCRAFIVGYNPASVSAVDFWSFWKPGFGFDKAAWFKTYLFERETRPLKPGKTRRNRISRTRAVIEQILESASPVRCLETNIYSTPSDTAHDLAKSQRSTAPFDYLLKTIKPALILAHGREAVAHLSEHPTQAKVIEINHLSRGFSNLAAKQLGQQIANYFNCN